jgi:hypothetical protein
MDMTADYAAQMALSIADRSWEKGSARFLYCALTKDEDCPLAMYIMARFLRNGSVGFFRRVLQRQ